MSDNAVAVKQSELASIVHRLKTIAHSLGETGNYLEAAASLLGCKVPNTAGEKLPGNPTTSAGFIEPRKTLLGELQEIDILLSAHRERLNKLAKALEAFY